jgi:hypothetical protein
MKEEETMPGPIPRRAAMALMLGLAALAGCGEKEDDDKGLFDRVIIKLDDVPSKVMETARKEWPGVNFADAWTNIEKGRKEVHSYEVRGKDPQTGKVREVRVSVDGSKVLEKEG